MTINLVSILTCINASCDHVTPSFISIEQLTFEIVCGIACLQSEKDKDEAKKFLKRDEDYFAPCMN